MQKVHKHDALILTIQSLYCNDANGKRQNQAIVIYCRLCMNIWWLDSERKIVFFFLLFVQASEDDMRSLLFGDYMKPDAVGFRLWGILWLCAWQTQSFLACYATRGLTKFASLGFGDDRKNTFQFFMPQFPVCFLALHISWQNSPFSFGHVLEKPSSSVRSSPGS